MMQRIDGFEKGSVNLRRLINDLEALLDCLQSAEKAWKAVFLQEWGTLEDVYADALDTGQKVLVPESQKLVEDAVRKLKRLVEKALTGSSQVW
ncbi:hypothetical protein HYR99_08100, partial [Candidatus Poribacteria bacterium]|nr:hypothetical protein [Candidatus Poribacteria bacterium]